MRGSAPRLVDDWLARPLRPRRRAAGRPRGRAWWPSAATAGPSSPAVRHRRDAGPRRTAADIAALAERLWYPDLGRAASKLGHAVRTVEGGAVALAVSTTSTRPPRCCSRAATSPATTTSRRSSPGAGLEQWQKRGQAPARSSSPIRSEPRHEDGRRGRLPPRARPEGGPGRAARRPRPAAGPRPPAACLLEERRPRRR